MLPQLRQDIERLLDEGLSSHQVASLLEISVPQVAAIKAHRTMANKPAMPQPVSESPPVLPEVDLAASPLRPGRDGTFTGAAPLAGRTLSDFWSWAYGDVLSNANRGRIAEYLVGSALDALRDGRVEWDAVDLEARNAGGRSCTIEVKSSAFLQTWSQDKHSTPMFGVGASLKFSNGKLDRSGGPARRADVYALLPVRLSGQGHGEPLRRGSMELLRGAQATDRSPLWPTYGRLVGGAPNDDGPQPPSAH